MNALFRRVVTPLARAYIRYAPFSAGKALLWERLIEPHLAWQAFAFVASTVFGSWISGDTRDIIQQYIYYFGLWEPNLTRYVRERLMPGDTFIDVGANIGYFSLLASKCVGTSGAVVAIEASPRIFAALQDNLECNPTQNVRALNIAVSDKAGTLKLYGGGIFNSGATTTFEDPELVFEDEVDAAPLSSLLTPQETSAARIIKIDVEGAEWRVIEGMAEILTNGRDDLEIIVEVSPKHLALLDKTTAELLRVFADAGFHPYALENDYTAQGYLTPASYQPPARVCHAIEWETDIVFSRRDADFSNAANS